MVQAKDDRARFEAHARQKRVKRAELPRLMPEDSSSVHRICPVCESTVTSIRCKLVCPNCHSIVQGCCD